MVQPATTRAVETVRKWTFCDVNERFLPLAKLADEHGLLASLFGSTILYGLGNDLDVLMTERKDEVADVEGFLKKFGGQELSRKDRPEKGIFSVKVEKRGRYYDFCFGKVSEDRGRGI